jgi:hypothetical protein
MASTTLSPRTPGPGTRPAPSVVPGGGRQRRWSLALVAVLVTLGSALAFVVLWLNAGGRKPVLALRNDVVAGQVIEAGDLTVVRVSTDGGIDPIPSSQRDEVIGQPAAATLLAGSLLVEGAVGDSDGLEAGAAVIAIPVERVRLPDDLEAGDHVRIYRTVAAQGGEEDAGPETLGPGVVLAVEGGDDDTVNEVRVSVTVSESLAPAIASAVQADQIYIVKTAAG